ncbi:class A beta-lactamase-related serine hydrolase [Mucilaginibacter limnophilus]|uniref:Class A beta-lactamase-related serine hydrolase n=1 Tax=Mucilaginibacter limnophilus TaxID=1932778 RepID=A0A437MWI7_9SPHI|nr:serine hydrolase domain-containing protein [Mucilaginibacter limnophilus]RVU02042.1 class A beta-lactamase-related serine hydrolase [Mucilaginibacter limnophilus]
MTSIKLKAAAFLFSSIIAVSSFAQGLKQASPAGEGFSLERLKRIDSLFATFTKDYKIAGVVGLVARHGDIVYWNASGYKDIKNNKLLDKTDMFRIASQTKAVTCVAIMMLYEEGKLVLDDPISKYIPEFAKPQVLKTFNEKDTTYTTEPANREITIRDLLTHTSGIGYAVIGSKEMRAIYAKNNIPVGFEPRKLLLADRIKILAKLPIEHQPGLRYTYGLNMDVLGYIIEVASGRSLDQFFRERIFNPLGMKDTYFYVPAEKQARLSKVFSANDKGIAVENNSTDSTGANVIYPLQKGTYYGGGAGLTSTAYDYCLFLQMLANGGKLNGKRILTANSIRLMTSNQIGDIPLGTSPNKAGFSFEVVTPKGAIAGPWNEGTFAGGGYWGSSYWVDPKAGLVVQIWTQGGGWTLGDLTNKFKAIIYGALTNDYAKK